MPAWQEQSDFRIRPNPPQQGRDLDVTYVGNETTVWFQIDGGKPQRVKPDKRGRFRIDKRWLRGRRLFLTTKKGLPGFLTVEIARRK